MNFADDLRKLYKLNHELVIAIFSNYFKPNPNAWISHDFTKAQTTAQLYRNLFLRDESQHNRESLEPYTTYAWIGRLRLSWCLQYRTIISKQ